MKEQLGGGPRRGEGGKRGGGRKTKHDKILYKTIQAVKEQLGKRAPAAGGKRGGGEGRKRGNETYEA